MSLVSEATPDPMEGEQTWPTEEELQEAAGERAFTCVRVCTHVGVCVMYGSSHVLTHVHISLVSMCMCVQNMVAFTTMH